jgi:hypothetical protein
MLAYYRLKHSIIIYEKQSCSSIPQTNFTVNHNGCDEQKAEYSK